MLLYFMSELINVSLLKASDESLSGPLIYFILGPYSSNIRCQRSTLSVVKLSNVRFLWSIYTVIICPKRILRNSFNVFTILNSYPYVVVSAATASPRRDGGCLRAGQAGGGGCRWSGAVNLLN